MSMTTCECGTTITTGRIEQHRGGAQHRRALEGQNRTEAMIDQGRTDRAPQSADAADTVLGAPMAPSIESPGGGFVTVEQANELAVLQAAAAAQQRAADQAYDDTRAAQAAAAEDARAADEARFAENRRAAAARGIAVATVPVDPTLQNDTDYSTAYAQRHLLVKAVEQRTPDPLDVKNPFVEQTGTFSGGTITMPADVAGMPRSEQPYDSDEDDRFDPLHAVAPLPPVDHDRESDDFLNVIARRGANQGDDDSTVTDHAYSPQTREDRDDRPIVIMRNASEAARRAESPEDLSYNERPVDADQYDELVGDVMRRSNAVFDWARDPKTKDRMRFTRHYFRRGIILDFFVAMNSGNQREVAEKVALLRGRNASVTPDQRIGYVALLHNATLRPEILRRARQGEVFGWQERTPNAAAPTLVPMMIDGHLTMVPAAA